MLSETEKQKQGTKKKGVIYFLVEGRKDVKDRERISNNINTKEVFLFSWE
jgi:hypothetical protein